MSKFDEILNSSNSSDALLGEQIDKLAEKTSIKIKTVTSTTLANGIINFDDIAIKLPNIILSVYLNHNNTGTTSTRYAIPTCYGSMNETWGIKCFNEDGTAMAAGKSVTLVIHYI